MRRFQSPLQLCAVFGELIDTPIEAFNAGFQGRVVETDVQQSSQLLRDAATERIRASLPGATAGYIQHQAIGHARSSQLLPGIDGKSTAFGRRNADVRQRAETGVR